MTFTLHTVSLPLASLIFPPAGKSCPPLNLLIDLLGGALKRCIFVVPIGVLVLAYAWHVCVGARGEQKRMLEALELDS